jgi:hypothetical protein
MSTDTTVSPLRQRTNRPERLQQSRSRKENYSITSSARASSACGTREPKPKMMICGDLE